MGKLQDAEQWEDRLPPHSQEAEAGVLGCVLLSPDCMGICVDKLPGQSAFYDLRNRTIYQSLISIYDANLPIDLISVMQHLKDGKQLQEAGGLPYLSSLPDTVPSAANIDYYIDIVREKWTIRQLIATCTTAAAKAYEHIGDVDVLLQAVDSDLRSVVDATSNVTTLRSASELIQTVNAVLDKAMTSGGQLQGLPTGFADFDKRSGGLQDGEMIVIAARPSVGKSSLAMNIAINVSKAAVPVEFFSLEMTAESLILRSLCSESKVALNNVRAGHVNDQELQQLANSSAIISHLPLFIDDASGLSILQLRARARRAQQLHGIKLFIIDYLQLLHSTRRRWSNDQEEAADISAQLKGMAKELDVPVIVLSQLNRDPEDRPNKKPRLSDLRKSGAIEQDADVVALIYNTEESDNIFVKIGLITAKSRNGPTGEDSLIFFKPYVRFESAAQPA